MTDQEEPKQQRLTGRAIFVSFCMVLLWTVGCCFVAIDGNLLPRQLLLVLGFGAILTVFLLRYPRVFMATVALVWVGVSVQILMRSSPADQARLTQGIVYSAPVALGLLGLGYWIHRHRLSRADLVVVFACVVIAIPWCICIKACMESSIANLFESQARSEKQMYAWARDLPWWAPTVPPPAPPPKPEELKKLPADDPARQSALARYNDALARHKEIVKATDERTTKAVRGFQEGNGGQVPWSLWWRPMAYWASMCLAFEAMLMGLLLMLRKRWIEHERLPFVWAQPAASIIHGPAPGERSRGRWIAFGLGLLICLPGLLLVSPTGETLSTWTVPPWVGEVEGIRGGVNLTRLNLLPGTNLYLYWGPLILAAFLLFPVDVLMTVALTYILIGLLVPGLMRSLGMQVGPKYVSTFLRYGLRFGGGIGLLFWSFWFARKGIWDYVRSLWSNRANTAEGDDEIGRRKVLFVTVAGFAGFIALGCYATTFIQMILLTGLILIFAFSQVRQRAEGQPLNYDNNFGSHMMVSVQRDFLHDHFTHAEAEGEAARATGHSWATHWMQWGFAGQLKSFGPHNMLLEAFRLGHEFRVHARSIAKAIAVTMLLVAVLTPLLYVQLMYVYGFANSNQQALTTWANFGQWSERAASYGIHSTSKVFYQTADNFYDRFASWFNMAYGFVLVGVLFHLRREHPRFPLSPVGVVIASETWSLGHGAPWSATYVWFSFLMAWVVKALVFRWLGVRYFREKVRPVVVMLICGLVFGIVLYLFRYVALGAGSLK